MSAIRTALLASVLIAGASLAPAHAQPVWQSRTTAVGSGNSVSVAKPSGTVQGDLLVAGITLEKGSDVSITASGWTLIRRTNNSTNAGMATYYKVAGASEPANYSFTLTDSPKWSVGISRITNAWTTNPINISAGTTGSGASVTAPTVTTTRTNTLVLAFYTNKKDATYTAAAGTSERYDAPNSSGGLPSNMMASFGQATAGVTGNKTATASESESWVGQQVAIREPPPPPTSFNAFETATTAGSITGVIHTKRAGAAFGLDIVAIRNGAQHIDIEGDVSVELLGNNTLGVSLDANDCPTSSTVLQTVSPFTVTSGRATINFSAVANSWRDVRVRVRWPTSSPTVTRCSSDNFAIRPDQLDNLRVRHNNWETAGTSTDLDETDSPGTPIHKAGRPFTVTAQAENSGGSVTTNYNGTPSGVLSDCGSDNACLPTFGTFSLGTSFSSGQLVSNVATYSEVGSFRLRLVDADYASVDASDGSTATEREVRSGTLDVGRFVPDHFDVAFNAPQFGSACAGGFTYIGETFNYTTAPVITVTAKNFAGGTTTNYAGSLWRITNSSLTGKAYSAATGSLDTTGDPSTDPVIAANGDGTGTLTFNSGTGFLFTRSTPVAPFDAEISLAINVADADGVVYGSNPARFGQSSAGNGIAFSSGKSMRFGRLVMASANGSQVVPLAVRVEAQYWGYTNPPTNTVLGFITNTADGCTSLANNNVQMSSFTGNLAACETAISGAGTLTSGRGTLVLPPPGSANSGSVLLTANLDTSASGTTCTSVGGGTVAAAGASRAYLQGAWSGSAYDDNPGGLISFGTRRGADELIFVRENY